MWAIPLLKLTKEVYQAKIEMISTVKQIYLWSAGLLEFGTYDHVVAGNDSLISATQLPTNDFDVVGCLKS